MRRPHNTLGLLLQEEGEVDLAANHIEKRSSCSRNSKSPMSPVGSLHEKTGDFAAAEACFRAALDDDESRSHALSRLAMLKRGKLADVDCKMMEEAIADPNTTVPARISLYFGLANVWDACRRYREAADVCARPTLWRSPSFSDEISCTIRPSTSDSFPG